jgi:sulfate/thiosulfate transport system permease protein
MQPSHTLLVPTSDGASGASENQVPHARGAAFRAPSTGDKSRLIITTFVLFYLGCVLVLPILALGRHTFELGFGNALGALTEEAAVDALQKTLLLIVISVSVNAVVGTIGAICVVRHKFWGKSIVSALYDLPLAVSPVMIGLGFVLLIGRGGILEPALTALGIKIMFSFGGILLGTLFVTLPFTMREVAYVLEEIGSQEEEAATTLGASPWQTFWHVTLPNIRFALGYGLLMTVARTVGEFGAVLVLGGSISGQTQTATTFIHDAIEERRLPAAYGMSLTLAFVSICLLLGLEWAKHKRKMRLSRSK